MYDVVGQDLLTWSQQRGVNEAYHRKNQDSDTLGDDRFINTGLRTLQAFAGRYIHWPISNGGFVICNTAGSNRVSTSNRFSLIVLTKTVSVLLPLTLNCTDSKMSLQITIP